MDRRANLRVAIAIGVDGKDSHPIGSYVGNGDVGIETVVARDALGLVHVGARHVGRQHLDVPIAAGASCIGIDIDMHVDRCIRSVGVIRPSLHVDAVLHSIAVV